MTGGETLISIRLPAAQAAQLRERADKQGASLESFVEQIVLREVREAEPLPRLQPAPYPEDDYVDGGWEWETPPFPVVGTAIIRLVDGGPLPIQPLPEE